MTNTIENNLPNQAVAPSATPPPPPPPAPAAPATPFKPDFTVISAPRSRSVVEIPLQSDSLTLYAREWGTKSIFGMIKVVQAIAERLAVHGVFKPSGLTTGADGRNQEVVTGILKTISESEKDVYMLVTNSISLDKAGKVSLKAEQIDEISVNDMVLLLQAIWHVNWETGALKKVLAGRTM